MNRRELLKGFPAAAGSGLLGTGTAAAAYARATRGLPQLKITHAKTILTNPPYANGTFSSMGQLVIVKVETSEPGLYGIGCASYCFRPGAVAALVNST